MHEILANLSTCLLYSFQPIGRAFALVQPTSERQPLKNEPVKVEGNVEVIKVSRVDQDAVCSNNS